MLNKMEFLSRHMIVNKLPEVTLIFRKRGIS